MNFYLSDQVECAAVNADFTCPVTQDILYRIMSTGDKYETYANVREADEIPILPPGKCESFLVN